MLKIAGVLLAILALFYGALVLLVYLFQRHLIYYPSRFPEPALIQEAAGAGLSPWRNSQGELIGWSCPHPQSPADARLIVLHGNANHAHWCDYYRDAFQSRDRRRRWDVFLLEYPGYASRPGSPGEKPLVDAAVEAVDELRRNDNRPVVLLGESIGAAVAAQVAARRPDTVDGMVFIAPFNNLSDLGAGVMPIIPVRWLLKDRFASDEALRSFHGPIAFLLAGQDEVIPNRFSQKLYDGYGGPKRLWSQPRSGHNTFNFSPSESFWTEIERFLFERPPSP